MLDPRQDAPGRDALAQEARGQIEAAGSLKHEKTWGLRKMAYEIDQRTEADYRWFRFEAPTELLDQLSHNLKIADGVLRFRIFKVDPDAPVIAPPAASAPAPSASRNREGEESAPPPPPAEPVAEPAVAEPVAEPAVAEPVAEPAVAEPVAEPAVAEPSAESGEEGTDDGPSTAAQ